MKGRILTDKQIAAFAVHLKNEEKSENTVEKYIRDVRAFAAYVGDAEIWQYTHWDNNKNLKKCPKNKRLLIYEGMAKWVKIQYGGDWCYGGSTLHIASRTCDSNYGSRQRTRGIIAR